MELDLRWKEYKETEVRVNRERMGKARTSAKPVRLSAALNLLSQNGKMTAK